LEALPDAFSATPATARLQTIPNSVQPLEDPFRLACRQRVIQGRRHVHQDDGQREQAAGGNEGRIAAPRCIHDEDRNADACCQQPGAVADAVGDFLPQRLLAPGPHAQQAGGDAHCAACLTA
jgi:hypothetical protein